MRIHFFPGIFLLLLISSLPVSAQGQPQVDAGVEKLFEKYAVYIHRDEKKPGNPVTLIDSYSAPFGNRPGIFKDQELRELIPVLAGLKHLHSLTIGVKDISNDTLQGLAAVQQVKHLELHLLGVSDDLLKDVAALPGLQLLDISGMKVTDAGLKNLPAAKKLEVLELYDTAITDAGLAHLVGMKLKQLALPKQVRSSVGFQHFLNAIIVGTELDLSDWKITDADFKGISKFQQIKNLDLYETLITDASLKEIGQLKNLRSLELSWTLITDAQLHQLEGLQLDYLKLPMAARTEAGFKSFLKALAPRQELTLWSWELSAAAVQELMRWKELRILNFAGCTLDADGLKELAALPALEDLTINAGGVTDDGLKHLAQCKKLKKLRIEGTDVTDLGLSVLAGLNLDVLKIPKDAKTDTGLKHFVAAQKAVTRLELQRWQITDMGLKAIAGLPQLAELDVSDTRITDAGMQHVKSFKQLKRLSLDKTAVTLDGLKQLAGMELDQLIVPPALRTEQCLKHYIAAIGTPNPLYLSGWQIGDASIPELWHRPKLYNLRLDGTLLTDQCIPHLAKLKNLGYLTLGKTRITEQGIKQLRKALPSCSIDY